MNITDLEVKFLKALAHPVRIKIVKKLLTKDKMCVCELNENVEFSQSNLSQHLKILKDAGILISEKIGLNMHYAIKNKEVNTLIEITDSIIKKEYTEIINNLS